MIQNILRNSKLLATVLTAVLVVGFVVGAIPTIAASQTSQSEDVVGHPEIPFTTSSEKLSADTTDELTISVVRSCVGDC